MASLADTLNTTDSLGIMSCRAAKQKDSAVLKELAIHFRNSRVLRSEAMVLQYSERLKSSGMEDLGSLLEEVVAREHMVAKMLTDATYLTALPLRGLISPPAPPTPRQQQVCLYVCPHHPLT